MSFYDEIVKMTNEVRNNSKLVNQIKDQLRLKAMSGEYCAIRVHELEGEYAKSINFSNEYSDFPIDHCDIEFTDSDRYIINQFVVMGFTISYTLVNKNSHPEFGQEGLDLAIYMNISWKQ